MVFAQLEFLLLSWPDQPPEAPQGQLSASHTFSGGSVARISLHLDNALSVAYKSSLASTHSDVVSFGVTEDTNGCGVNLTTNSKVLLFVTLDRSAIYALG